MLLIRGYKVSKNELDTLRTDLSLEEKKQLIWPDSGDSVEFKDIKKRYRHDKDGDMLKFVDSMPPISKLRYSKYVGRTIYSEDAEVPPIIVMAIAANGSDPNVDLVKTLVSTTEKYKSDVILVTTAKITNVAMQSLKSANANSPYKIWDFLYKDLIAFPVDLFLAPKLTLIKDPELCKEITSYYEEDPKNMPRILSSDALVKIFGADEGDVFDITRVNLDERSIIDSVPQIRVVSK